MPQTPTAPVNSQPKARLRSALLGGTLVASAGLFLLMLPVATPLMELSYDIPFLFRRDIKPENVVIVYMDWDSHIRLGQQQFQRWDRRLHARLVDRLREMGAKTVAFDIVFLPQTNSLAEDKQLIRAVKQHGSVVVAGLVAPDVEDGHVAGWKLTKPFPELEAVAAWGLAEVGDENKSIRQHYFRRDYDVRSLAWRTAELTLTNFAADPFEERWINYYGSPGLFPHFSFWEVLNEALPSNSFSNKVVFVGALYDVGMTGGKGTDDFRTPYTRVTGRRAPGVEIVATAYVNLARGDWLKRLPPARESLIILLLGALAGFTLTRQPPIVAAGWGIAGFVTVAVLATISVWQTSTWFPWLIIAGVQLPFAVAWSILSSASDLWRENRSLKRQMLAAEEAQKFVLDNTPAAAGPLHLKAPLNHESQIVDHEGPSIPDHHLLRRIGKGAYGEVWLARNAIGIFHAVKIVYRRAFGDDKPFEREFNGLRRFMPISRKHSGFVHILHVGRNDEAGYIYYVMELADDETSGQNISPQKYSPKNLATELRHRKRLPLNDCLQLGLDLTAALNFLHEQRLIHRDIKPANIVFVNGVPKLADIGLVTDAAPEPGNVTYLGTKGYIPPEGPGTPAGDLYGVGKVLYEASLGFDVSRFPELPTELVRDGSDSGLLRLNAIIIRACENEPNKRYASAVELQKDLFKLRDTLAVDR